MDDGQRKKIIKKVEKDYDKIVDDFRLSLQTLYSLNSDIEHISDSKVRENLSHFFNDLVGTFESISYLLRKFQTDSEKVKWLVEKVRKSDDKN